jgi:hypothetical protein
MWICNILFWVEQGREVKSWERAREREKKKKKKKKKSKKKKDKINYKIKNIYI